MLDNPLAPPWLIRPGDANALESPLWPATAQRTPSGELAIGGVSASRLAADYGTPLYVVDEADARARAARTREAFVSAFAAHGSSATVYYASKALLTTEVARWMVEAGLRLDVASGGELAVALAAGVDPALYARALMHAARAECDERLREGGELG